MNPYREYQIKFRFLSPEGQPTGLRFRFFRTAREAHQFLIELDAFDARQPYGVGISTREVPPWTPIPRLELERRAFEESGGEGGR